mgnify:CR=1 FL=1
MAYRFTKFAPLIVLAPTIVAAFVAIGYLQHSAMGQSTDKVGTITGVIDNPMIATDTAVVFIKEVLGDAPAPKDKGSMSQKKITFNPRVLPVVVGTTIECPNDDTVTHNIFSPTKSAKAFNFGLYPPGSKKEIVANKVGVIPFLCNIHAEMAAFVVVCPNAYFAKTEKDGKFKIENVPEGKYKLTFWHEKLRPKTVEVTVTAGATENVTFTNLEKGKYSIDLLK